MPTGIVCQTRVPEEVSRLSPDFVPRREWYGPTLIPPTVAMPLAGAVAAVTWNPIPATYSFLELVYYARGDTAATSTLLAITFNNDAGGITYNNIRDNWDGAGVNTPASVIAGASIILGSIAAGTAPANFFDMGRVTIPAYAGSVGYKTCVNQFGLEIANTAAGTRVGLITGWWKNTNPITRLDITPGAGNLIIGCDFRLLGYA